MKKILSAIAVVLLLSSACLAKNSNDVYVGVGTALESVSAYDYDGMALVVNAGKPVKKVGKGMLVVEGEVSYSLIPPSYDWEYSPFPYTSTYYNTAEIYFTTVGLYAGYVYDINENVYIKPRIGLLYLEDDDEEQYSTTGISIGVGAGYKLNKSIDLYTDYTRLDGSYLTHFTIGVLYHY